MADLDVRPEVAWFAQKMEERLREKDPENPGGWKDCGTFYLLLRLQEEMGELAEAVLRGSPEEVIKECVDISNFGMMLADVRRSSLVWRAK